MVMNNHSLASIACPFILSVDWEWGRSYTPCLIAFKDKVSRSYESKEYEHKSVGLEMIPIVNLKYNVNTYTKQRMIKFLLLVLVKKKRKIRLK